MVDCYTVVIFFPLGELGRCALRFLVSFFIFDGVKSEGRLEIFPAERVPFRKLFFDPLPAFTRNVLTGL